MFRLLLVFCVIIATLVSVLLSNKNPPPSLSTSDISDTYTTFLGSDYSILIDGELTKAHVQRAESVIGTIKGVQIGTLVTSIGNAEDTADTAPFYGKNNINSLTFKGTSICETIGLGAFYGCTGITSVTIPKSVTSIEDYAFRGCGLTSIVVPNSVISIGYTAFFSCTSLTSVTIGNSVTSIGDYAFASCTSLTSVSIGNSVISIGNNSFNTCTSLTSVVIPNSVTSIGNGAFNTCNSLTSVTIGNSVISIGNYSFYGCPNLTLVIIPDSVTVIGDYAFNNCTGLDSVSLSNSLITTGDAIGTYAFYNCPFETQVEFRGNTESRVINIGDLAFNKPDSLTAVLDNGGGPLTIKTTGDIYT